MKLTLVRILEAPNGYTYGRIEDEEHRQLCVTCEEPWRDENHDGLGDTGVSRIPPGEFEGFIRTSYLNGGTGKRKYDVPELLGVPGRKNVQIHIGNDVDDTEGCVLVGTRYAAHGSIEGSRDAFAALMKHLDGVEHFTLVVRDELSCAELKAAA